MNDASASRYLNDSEPFVMQSKGNAVEVPAAWRAVAVRSYTSYVAIAQAFKSGAIGPDVGAILYDNEHWKFTPVEEQRNYASYTQKAADLVHAHRLTFIATPAVDLIKVLDPRHSGARYERFLNLGVIGQSARYADAVDIQAQGAERNVAMFSDFVRRAAAQARAANARVIVFAGISTGPSGQRVTSDDVMRAVDATRDMVDGYWFNVPQQSEYCPNCMDFRPDIAIDVFQRLSTANNR
ncbi:MAG TPA: hypothetical protein VF741_06085 [Candidatus Aquilonibacter sp.]